MEVDVESALIYASGDQNILLLLSNLFFPSLKKLDEICWVCDCKSMSIFLNHLK